MYMIKEQIKSRHSFVDVAYLWENPKWDQDSNTPPGKRYNTKVHIGQEWWEGALLWKYCMLTKGDILEIGRRCGGSAALMLEATTGTNRIVTSVDIKSVETSLCISIFEKHKDRYNSIVGNSLKVTIDDDYGLLFIDGNHTYEHVKADTERHWDKLHTGGVAVYHDYLSPKWGPDHVKKHLDEWMGHGRAKKLEIIGTSIAMEKLK